MVIYGIANHPHENPGHVTSRSLWPWSESYMGKEVSASSTRDIDLNVEAEPIITNFS
jgi:hypothetical protein